MIATHGNRGDPGWPTLEGLHVNQVIVCFTTKQDHGEERKHYGVRVHLHSAGIRQCAI